MCYLCEGQRVTYTKASAVQRSPYTNASAVQRSPSAVQRSPYTKASAVQRSPYTKASAVQRSPHTKASAVQRSPYTKASAVQRSPEFSQGKEEGEEASRRIGRQQTPTHGSLVAQLRRNLYPQISHPPVCSVHAVCLQWFSWAGIAQSVVC